MYPMIQRVISIESEEQAALELKGKLSCLFLRLKTTLSKTSKEHTKSASINLDMIASLTKIITTHISSSIDPPIKNEADNRDKALLDELFKEPLAHQGEAKNPEEEGGSPK